MRNGPGLRPAKSLASARGAAEILRSAGEPLFCFCGHRKRLHTRPLPSALGPDSSAERPSLLAEEGRLVRAFEHALAVALILPLGVIGCSQDTARSKADASPPKDACVPSLEKVFFGTVDGSPECRATQR